MNKCAGIIILFICILCGGCTSIFLTKGPGYGNYPPLTDSETIEVYLDEKAAPPLEEIGIIQCSGLIEFMKEPTFDSAVIEAKSIARKNGGNVVVFMDTIDDFPEGPGILYSLLGTKNKSGCFFPLFTPDEDAQIYVVFKIGKKI